MKPEEVAGILLKGRIVDLSMKITPGKALGAFGGAARRYEIKSFSYEPGKVWSGIGETMHTIEMENHISTHVECPSHFVPARHGRSAPDVSEVPLTQFFGTAVFVDCKGLPAKTGIGADILKKFPIQKDDIVLIGNMKNLGEKGENRGYLSKEGAEYLLSKKVKLVAFDDTVFPENPAINKIETMFTHDLMLSAGIPLIERLAHLDQLKQQRFVFFCIPAAMGGLDSFPIRAVAIEV